MIEYRHHSPNKLSGGQKQRVAIAGVVAMEPKCIVLDLSLIHIWLKFLYYGMTELWGHVWRA